MAKGIRFPVDVDPRGGAETLEGPELLKQNIMLGVMPASSLHPWNQKLTPRDDTIFDINDRQTGGSFEGHVYQLFEDLERLDMATISKTSQGIRTEHTNANRGDFDVIISYIDLEEQKSREVRFPGNRGGS